MTILPATAATPPLQEWVSQDVGCFVLLLQAQSQAWVELMRGAYAVGV